MKLTFCLSLAFLLAGSLVPLAKGETVEPSAPPPPAVSATSSASSASLMERLMACRRLPADAELPQAFAAALAEMERTKSEDFVPLAELVLQKHGRCTDFLRLMRQAAAEGKAPALLWMARHESKAAATPEAAGEGMAQALAALKKIAERYPAAALEYGLLVGQGFGPEKDAAKRQKEATAYLMQACKDGGNARARAYYLRSSGRLQKGKKADGALKSELEKKNFYVEELMAFNYDLGGAMFSYWMKRAYEHGSAHAPYFLALGSTDETEQMKLLLEACDRHCPEAYALASSVAMERIVPALLEGKEQAMPDMGNALRGMEIAAMLDLPFAYSALAAAYAQGYAGLLPAEEIAALFHEGQALRDAAGRAGYAYCLLTGRGVPQQAEQGLALLQSVSDQEVPWVNQALASAYFNGDGVPPSLGKAAAALNQDAAAGSRHAFAVLAALQALGNAERRADAFRASSYLEAARQQDPQADIVYGQIMVRKGWRFFPALWPGADQAIQAD